MSMLMESEQSGWVRQWNTTAMTSDISFCFLLASGKPRLPFASEKEAEVSRWHCALLQVDLQALHTWIQNAKQGKMLGGMEMM